MFRHLLSLLVALLGCTLLVAQDPDKGPPWPERGSSIPRPFDFYHINGPAKGRYRCLVCHAGLVPTAIVFAREPAKGKEGPLYKLITALEVATEEFEHRGFATCVVFLSPDAHDSTNNAAEQKSSEIIKEAIKREQLVKRLTAVAETLKLKNTIVGYYLSEGPKGYKLDPKADVSMVFYERMKVQDFWVFQPDRLQDKDVDMIMAKVRETLALKKKG